MIWLDKKKMVYGMKKNLIVEIHGEIEKINNILKKLKLLGFKKIDWIYQKYYYRR